MMTAKEMLSKVDHTQLKAFATWEDIVEWDFHKVFLQELTRPCC